MPILQSARLAADFLGVGRTKLLALARSGRVEAKRLDGRLCFTTQSLERFAESLPSANDNTPDRSGDLLLQSVKARAKRGRR